VDYNIQFQAGMFMKRIWEVHMKEVSQNSNKQHEMIGTTLNISCFFKAMERFGCNGLEGGKFFHISYSFIGMVRNIDDYQNYSSG